MRLQMLVRILFHPRSQNARSSWRRLPGKGARVSVVTGDVSIEADVNRVIDKL